MKDNKELYTAAEIVRRNPIILKYWTAADVGYLFKMQIVHGLKKTRSNLINETDVLKIFYLTFPRLMHPLPVA